MKRISTSDVRQAAKTCQPRTVTALHLLASVLGELPDEPDLHLSDDRMALTLAGWLPDLCRVASALARRFLSHGSSFDELYLCHHGRRTWLYLSTHADPSENQLRMGVVNYNKQLPSINKFKLK